MALTFEWDENKAALNERNHGVSSRKAAPRNGYNMNNEINQTNEEHDDMQAEYDFSGGTRGKHYRAFQEGYTVRINKADGTIAEETYISPPRTVVLDPDVFAYFSDSESVNHALRLLVNIAKSTLG